MTWGQNPGQHIHTIVAAVPGRGRDDHAHLAPEPAPVGEFTERNVQARREVLYACPNSVYFGVILDDARPSFPDQPTA